ncbi:MAG: sulfotransferase domain-containing protein [bacterium]
MPDFVIIGAQKCGTSTLIKNIALHPDIYITQWSCPGHGYGEVYFFDVNWYSGTGWYRSLFKEGKICGEKSPDYMISKLSMKRLYSIMPNAKLFICLRDPVRRLISQVNMRRRGDNASLAVADVTEIPEYIERGMYYSHIQENVLPYFAPEQICIIISDEMDYTIDRKSAQQGETHGLMVCDRSNHIASIMEKAFTFLDLPMINAEFKYHYVGDYNKGLVVSDQELERLQAIYKKSNEHLFQFLGRRIDSWL